jgi:hypothetical protein
VGYYLNLVFPDATQYLAQATCMVGMAVAQDYPINIAEVNSQSIGIIGS